MPPETPTPSPKDNALRTIRTFESDVADVLQKENITKTKIALAEGKRQQTTVREDSTPAYMTKTLNLSSVLPNGMPKMRIPWKLVGIILGVAALIGIGVLVYLGAMRTREARPDEPEQTSAPAQTAYAVTIDRNDTRVAFIDKMRKVLEGASTGVNEVEEIPVRIGGAALTTGELLRVLEARAPASLTRALDPRVTFGVHGFRGAQPFMLFPVQSYDHAFSDMLAWEKTMLDDIGPLFGVTSRALSAETGTTTDEVLKEDLRLKDAIMRNKDVRALFDKNGSVVFLYSFLDKQTLLITTSEDTFRVLQNKTSAGRLKLPAKQ